MLRNIMIFLAFPLILFSHLFGVWELRINIHYLNFVFVSTLDLLLKSTINKLFCKKRLFFISVLLFSAIQTLIVFFYWQIKVDLISASFISILHS